MAAMRQLPPAEGGTRRRLGHVGRSRQLHFGCVARAQCSDAGPAIPVEASESRPPWT